MLHHFPLPELKMLSFPHKLTVFFLRSLSSSSLSSSHQQHEDADEQSLINLCSSDVDAALLLLDRRRLLGHRPSSYLISSLLLSLCSSSRYLDAHRRLSLLLLSSHYHPDPATANSLISRLLDSRRTPHRTLNLIELLSRKDPNFAPSLTNYNRLIDQLCSLSHLTDALELLRSMPRKSVQPNTVSYTTMINAYARIGRLDDACLMFDEMRHSGVSPNLLTLSVMIKAFLRKRKVKEGRELMVKLWEKMSDDKDRDPSARSAAFANLIDSLCREGLFHEVFRIAEEMPQGEWVKEEFVYGQMIDSLCRVGRHHGASRIVYIMRKRGYVPSLVSYNSIIHGMSKGRGCMRAYQLFKEGIGFGYSLPEVTYKVLVEGLCKERDLNKAKDVAEFMLGVNGIDKTKIYNIFLSALRLVDNPSEQLNVLILMLQKQCKPDIVTLNTVIHGYCKIGKVTEASKILNDMLKGKFCSPDVVTFTTVISGFLDVGKREEAFDLLNQVMPEYSCSPNFVTYNVVLSGLCKLKKVSEAMGLFTQMISKGVSADNTTYTVIIEGLCEVGQLEEAKRFWDDVVWPSKIHNDYVYAAILRGLCRSGKFDAACDFLYELVDCGIGPGIVNYNILVDAAYKLGLKTEAYLIVREMKKNGLKADAVTWRILDKFHDRGSKVHLNGNGYLTTENRICVEKIEEEKSGVYGEGEHDEIVKHGNECLTTEKIIIEEESRGENTGKGVYNDRGCYEIAKHEDPSEGFSDPCFSTEVLKSDRISEELTVTSKVEMDAYATISEKEETMQLNEKEPLSKIARRVFGLL